MKRCPHCAEDLPDEAVACKHCGHTLAARRNMIHPRAYLVIAGTILSIGNIVILSYMSYLDGSIEPVLAAPLTYVCCSMGPIVFCRINRPGNNSRIEPTGLWRKFIH